MAFHLSRRNHEEEEAPGELNIVPYLDILMNLIIFMLLSMAGLATYGMLNVSARSGRGGPVDQPSVTLTVAVARAGFFVTADGQPEPSATIPLNGHGAYDYDGLTAKMQQLKRTFPSESKLIITAEADVDYEVLVATIDATRETADRKLLFPDVTLANF